MKVLVHIMLKEGVLDPQGKAVEHALRGLGFAEASSVRLGRLVEMDVAGDTATARERVDSMCRQLLANPVIERYQIEVG
ncbi:MAG: phosphoribosylformylglycinamidine synthase subunit PurS [Deltaproteobacteria bacterium]|nr:phosphoribosylformylglycinamidine synthase subunit PurS [Deltaproteobacteria bacterium]